MDETIGNPHMREVDYAYLAGVVDGEGTITLERTGKRRMNGVMGLSPKLIVANTDFALLQRCANILIGTGVTPHLKTQAAGYGTSVRRKEMGWLTVQGLRKADRVLRPLLPYLVAKQAQARILLDFIAFRGEAEQAKGKPYGPYELGLLEQIRALNFRGVTETEDHGLRQRIKLPREANDSPAR